jgi:hypothetical protein
MKVFLMHPDRDVDLEQELPPNEQALIQDLELERLLTTMAAGDKFLLDVARRVVLTSLTDRDLIGYRQRVLADCIERPAIIQRVYDIAVDAIGSERKVWFGILFRDSPESILRRSVQVMELLVGNLRQLRQVADDHAREFQSVGFTRLFAMLADELDDEYFATIEEHLRQLKFRHGVLMSAELGKGNKGVLRAAPARPVELVEPDDREGRPQLRLSDPRPGRCRLPRLDRTGRPGTQSRGQRTGPVD